MAESSLAQRRGSDDNHIRKFAILNFTVDWSSRTKHVQESTAKANGLVGACAE